VKPNISPHRPAVAMPPRRLSGPVAACVIANPSAGRGGRLAALEVAVERWRRRGWSIAWHWTGGPGDATSLARSAAADGIEVVAVAGGDGTVNEVANGLAGSATALAILPAGTANVLAAQLGLVRWPSPLRTPDLSAAADSLAAGVIRRVDLGLAEPTGRPGRHFLLWAGVGLDAAIVATIEGPGRPLKERFGALGFAWVALRSAMREHGGEAVVRIDGVRTRGWLRGIVLHNIPLYAGLVHLAPEARLDDGRLDAVVLMGDTQRGALGAWLRAGHAASPGAFVRRVVLGRSDSDHPLATPAEVVHVVGRPPQAVHVDAEPWGTTPVRFSVVPGALALVVPAGAPAALFQAGATPGPRVAAGAFVRRRHPAAVDR
jgi:diacylglycerol kinase family enzyme